MSARSAAERGRRAAARLMVDTATISRAGTSSFDASTGLLTATASTVVHTGPCRLRSAASIDAAVVFGEEQVVRSAFVACFPHDVVDVHVGDVITITESDDADVFDRSFRVTSVPMLTYSLYKGFPCEVIE